MYISTNENMLKITPLAPPPPGLGFFITSWIKLPGLYINSLRARALRVASLGEKLYLAFADINSVVSKNDFYKGVKFWWQTDNKNVWPV